MDFAEVIGSVAACFNVLTFIPQVYKTWKVKSAGDISTQTFIVSSVNTSLWVAYGIMLDKPSANIYMPNAIVLVLSIAQIILKIKYDRANNKQGIAN
jgi:MtN3 and saliva related transmembrane protein